MEYFEDLKFGWIQGEASKANKSWQRTGDEIYHSICEQASRDVQRAADREPGEEKQQEAKPLIENDLMNK